MSRPGENYRPYSLAGRVFWRIGHTTGSFFRGLRESALWGWQAAREDFSKQPARRTSGKTKRPILTLLLVVVPIAVVAVALGPPEWFINWPVMLAASIVLAQILRGPLAEAPSFLRKCVKLAISFCLLIAFTKLLYWKPLWAMLAPPGAESSRAWIMVISVLGWWVAVFWIIFSRPRSQRALAGVGHSRGVREASSAGTSNVSTVPQTRFSDVGGMEAAKEQIRQLVRGQLEPGKYKPYGVVRNGILLHGPRGSGKTFLAKATAGEFGLNFWYVSSPELLEKWIGTTGGNIRGEFSAATQRKPVLFFIDEVDCLGAGRQMRGSGGDPGGAGREFNNMVVQLMQSIDYYRELPGFVLMAATNVLDGLDEALTRPGRFDLKLRIDLPDETTRLKIFEAQLSKKPWHRFDLKEFARKTPGASAAKIRALVDQAAAFAADEGRNIEEHDLFRALKAGGGTDRPLVQPVQWQDIVLEEHVEQDLRMLIQLLNDSGRAERLGVGVPTGLLLLGPPGTGKSMIARLIATESRRSFYPITAADVLGGITGESVKRVSEVFARAREHSPSIIFVDEMDGLLPGNNRYVAQHDLQIVEQFMIEISNLQPEHNVFLVGATNHLENVDPRVLRGGRFSEKISIGLPGPEELQRLLGKYLEGVRLEPGLSLDHLAEHLSGLAPADLEAISKTAKRFAFNRAGQGDQLPALNLNDFKMAAERVRGAA